MGAFTSGRGQGPGPLKCYVTLFFWKFDTHPLVTLISYIFITLFFQGNLTPSHLLLCYMTLEWAQITDRRDRRLLVSPPKHTGKTGKQDCRQISEPKFRQQDSNPGPPGCESYALTCRQCDVIIS